MNKTCHRLTLPARTLPLLPAVASSHSTARLRGIAALVGLLLSGICSNAQRFSIDAFAIAGGGGTSAGGTLGISGTIGQPDANPPALKGGTFSVIGGFWSLFAVQTPGAPLLSISLDPQSTGVTVSWPSPSAGFLLQQKSDLNEANWVNVPATVTDNGTKKFIVINPSAGNRYFRLFKP